MSGACRYHGFSLVELLIAMVLGLVLVGGTLSIFSGNLRSAEVSQALMTMQANARFALDEMGDDIRAAGYSGCAGIGNTPFSVNVDEAPLDASNPAGSLLSGARVAHGGWQPATPPGYTPPSDRAVPVPGTDALLVQFAEAPGEVLQSSMNSREASLGITGTLQGLEPGRLAIVADCTGADLFTIGSRGGSVGNVTLQPDRALARAYRREPRHPLGARVLPFVSAIYYVGDTGRLTASGAAIRALYLQTFPYDLDANPPLELIEGVDQMLLAFGVREPSGDVRFLRADAAGFEPRRIASVRVGLLMSSLQPLDTDAATRTFSLAGQPVLPEGSTTPPGAVFYPADRRLRIGFERDVTVRNRGFDERAS